MLFPDWLVVWLAVAGISAFILGARTAAVSLLIPSIIRFGILPSLPTLPPGVAQIILIAAVPVVAVFGAILLLQRAVNAVYGGHAGGYVAGTYLVRVFDAVGGIAIAVLVLLAFAVWIWTLM